jgi:protein ImuA
MAEIAPIVELRRRIARIEGGGKGVDGAVLPFGVAAIDAWLPGGGLRRGALHEVGGVGPDAEDGAVPAAFIAGLCARLDPGKPVLWCEMGAGELYGPGLAAAGLAPGRLILARPRNVADLLWAMEEGLKCRALAAVVGEMAALSGPASRRLQLAAEATGVTAFALRRGEKFPQTKPIFVENKANLASETKPIGGETKPISAIPNAAVTRWHVAALPGGDTGEPGLGRPLWRLDLWRVRGGAPAGWIVEASDATGHVALPAALGDGAARQERRRASA